MRSKYIEMEDCELVAKGFLDSNIQAIPGWSGVLEQLMDPMFVVLKSAGGLDTLRQCD